MNERKRTIIFLLSVTMLCLLWLALIEDVFILESFSLVIGVLFGWLTRDLFEPREWNEDEETEEIEQ